MPTFPTVCEEYDFRCFHAPGSSILPSISIRRSALAGGSLPTLRRPLPRKILSFCSCSILMQLVRFLLPFFDREPPVSPSIPANPIPVLFPGHVHEHTCVSPPSFACHSACRPFGVPFFFCCLHLFFPPFFSPLRSDKNVLSRCEEDLNCPPRRRSAVAEFG